MHWPFATAVGRTGDRRLHCRFAADTRDRARGPTPKERTFARVSVLPWIAALACWLSLVGTAVAQTRIALAFHVATEDGANVATPEFLETQLAHANAIFQPLGLELVMDVRAPLPARHAALETRADRDALARYVRPGAVHCFVVARLMDVDEPGRERRGVHWKPRRAPRRRFVVVSKISGPYVLAHELSHFFGNQAHSDTPGNLMSYERTAAVPALEPAQIARIRATLARTIAQGELRALE
jgi:hypothetical protein